MQMLQFALKSYRFSVFNTYPCVSFWNAPVAKKRCSFINQKFLYEFHHAVSTYHIVCIWMRITIALSRSLSISRSPRFTHDPSERNISVNSFSGSRSSPIYIIISFIELKNALFTLITIRSNSDLLSFIPVDNLCELLKNPHEKTHENKQKIIL